MRAPRRWWAAFTALSVVHVAAQVLGAERVADVTKPGLMPLLIGVAATSLAPGRTRRLVVLALAWSTAGDVLLIPDGETWFLAGLGAFLVAQLTYVAAMRPWLGASALGVRRWRLVPYAAALVALLAAVLPGLGPLAPPVVVYAVVIMTMAAAATGVGRLAALGAASFVVSDALIALTSLTDLVALPRPGAWVMTTYLAGQAAIVGGLALATAQGPGGNGGAARPGA